MKPEIYAWVFVEGEHAGNIVGVDDEHGQWWMAIDSMDIAMRMQPIAEDASSQTNSRVHLLRFSNPEEIAVVDGRKK